MTESVISNLTCHCFTGCEYDAEKIGRLISSTGVLSCVHPGDRVFVKPNWVQERHLRRDEWVQMITHPSVITAVIDILVENMAGSGTIIVGDSPMTPANFDEIVALMPVEEWRRKCEEGGISFSLVDMRNERWNVSGDGIILSSVELPGDPSGKTLYNVEGDLSEFFTKETSLGGYYGASYDIEETNRAHDGQTNLYEMGGSVMEADIFVNLPKLKTHKKAGMTCCLKNLVGVSTNKNLLTHHTVGAPADGGDQFAENGMARKAEGVLTARAKSIANLARPIARVLVPLKWIAKKVWGDNRAVARNGSWFGNDTLWRTILDLNKILLYGNLDGTLSRSVRMGYVAIVDGIVAGEGEGPLEPDPVDAGVLLCGGNPVIVDMVASRIMGFDFQKIPSLAHAFKVERLPLVSGLPGDVMCSMDGRNPVSFNHISPVRRFTPPSGWVGHVELDSLD